MQGAFCVSSILQRSANGNTFILIGGGDKGISGMQRLDKGIL